MSGTVTPNNPEGTAPSGGPRALLISLVFWLYMLVSCPVLFMGALMLFVGTAPFDRRRRWLHLYTCAWAYHYVKLLPLWSCRFEGVENIRPDTTYILTANHQSLGDILLLFGLFKHFKWVSKRSIFAVPFIGWNMRLNDYVGLVRGDTASIQRMLEHCRRHLRAGSSVMLFPEGTRSMDGEIKPFKRGAFALAQELGLPVVPIVVEGSRTALPKRGIILRQRTTLHMRVSVLEPVAHDTEHDVTALSARVREQMMAELARLRG